MSLGIDVIFVFVRRNGLKIGLKPDFPKTAMGSEFPDSSKTV